LIGELATHIQEVRIDMTTDPTTSGTTDVVSDIAIGAKHASVQETLQKVDASLVPAIESFVRTMKSNTSTMPGLDYLHVRNDLLLSYLIDLVVWIRDFQPGTTDSGKDHRTNLHRRLIETRTILDKARGLDKKLRYQIDKLLSVASSSSSAFVTAGEKDDDVDGTRDGSNDDPLHFRPDLASFKDVGDDDDDHDNKKEEEEDDDSNGSNDSNSDDDSELAAARAIVTESKQNSLSSKGGTGMAGDQYNNDNSNNKKKFGSSEEVDGVYRAPHLTAVPYTHDAQNKQREASKRERKRLHTTEMAQMLRSQYGDAPELEDIHGGGTSDYGKQRLASLKLREHETERNKYEESAMIRLTTSRKEKKDRKRVKQMEGSNLAMMAGLGNLVQESKSFFQSSDNNSDDGEDYDRRTKERRGGDDDHRPRKRMRDAGRGGGHGGGRGGGRGSGRGGGGRGGRVGGNRNRGRS
jgi:U3 small nucleolar ribonucleoprotein protein LCP5